MVGSPLLFPVLGCLRQRRAPWVARHPVPVLVLVLVVMVRVDGFVVGVERVVKAECCRPTQAT